MKIKLINLESRPDRLKSVTDELHKFGVTEFERFNAFNGGYEGFNKSMSEALRGEEEILIIEDDCQFFGCFNDLLTAKSKLPNDWDLLYLGANVLSEQTKYTDGIWHLNNGWTSHAILYSTKAAQWVFENFNPNGAIVFDEWLRTVAQKQLKCFIVNPFIAIQKPDYSDIQNQYAEYNLKATEEKLI